MPRGARGGATCRVALHARASVSCPARTPGRYVPYVPLVPLVPLVRVMRPVRPVRPVRPPRVVAVISGLDTRLLL